MKAERQQHQNPKQKHGGDQKASPCKFKKGERPFVKYVVENNQVTDHPNITEDSNEKCIRVFEQVPECQ
jgi:hypothetical protein